MLTIYKTYILYIENKNNIVNNNYYIFVKGKIYSYYEFIINLKDNLIKLLYH